MRFRITLTPDILAEMPEPVKSEIIHQLPRQVARQDAAIVRAQERLDNARRELVQWQELDYPEKRYR